MHNNIRNCSLVTQILKSKHSPAIYFISLWYPRFPVVLIGDSIIKFHQGLFKSIEQSVTSGFSLINYIRDCLEHNFTRWFLDTIINNDISAPLLAVSRWLTFLPHGLTSATVTSSDFVAVYLISVHQSLPLKLFRILYLLTVPVGLGYTCPEDSRILHK